MNQEFVPPDANSSPAAATAPTAGQLLRNAREERQISLAELVSETRIGRATLEALEADHDPPQNAAVFVRGYLKRCAKVLGIDENALMRAYDARVVTAPPPQLISIRQNNPEYATRRSAAPTWLLPVLIGGVIFGGVISAVAVLKDDKPDADRRSETRAATPRVVELTPHTLPQQEPEQAPADTAARADSSIPLLLQPVPSQEDTSPQEDTPESDGETAVDTAAAEQPAPNVPAAAGTLFLEFSSPCWTVVVDDDNDRLLYGMFKAGDRQQAVGEPPYRISLGFAPGVKLYYEGKPVDFSAKISRDTTARFTVPF
ncbi:MAG: RodZ domain-containing protein [Nevskiales bacterium]